MTDLTRPVLDPEVEAAVTTNSAGDNSPTRMGVTSLTPDGIPALREQAMALSASDETLRHGGRVEFEELTVPGFEGGPDVPVLVLRPTAGSGPRPGICFTHCGGKVASGTRMAVDILGLLDWVADFNVVAVVVAVRVGPEHPHPAQVHDGYAGLLWVAENAASLGVAPDRIALFGASGGGGVAAATALFARDRGGPAVSHQVLLSPMLDDREITVSSHFENVIWDRTSNRTGWSAILGDECGGPDVSPYAAPSRATDLSGLPPAYLDAGSADTFRDETIDYGARLAQAGVPVDLHIWAGAMHGSEGVAPKAEVTRAAITARLSYLRRIFGPTPIGPDAG
ncbi:alpha/beta hydrolase [Streptomyces sp. NBC_00075]|uniref:alpha/beta hydrolase fold domain-containing protein n=1 Tax=Streptomyces sp. NBC_00075 TaxID=2975641 RepID=UPI003249494D